MIDLILNCKNMLTGMWNKLNKNDNDNDNNYFLGSNSNLENCEALAAGLNV